MPNRLYVGNLSYRTSQDQLQEMFAEAGQVVSAQVMSDRYSGQSRGFGFVEMSTDEETQNAIRLMNGRTIEGRALVVNEARPREASGAGGGGGYRGGGGGGSYGGGGNYGGGGGGNYSGGGGGGSYGGDRGGGGSRGGGRSGGGGGNSYDRYEKDRY